MLATKDITRSVLCFREAVRNNWNSYFHRFDNLMGPDVQDAFSRVEEGLFQALVMSLYDCQHDVVYRLHSLPFLLVAPGVESSSLTMQIGLHQNGSTVWDNPVRCDIGGDDRFEFIKFFDWNPYGQISMSLVLVYISRLDSRPEFVGAKALLFEHEVRFLLIDVLNSENPPMRPPNP